MKPGEHAKDWDHHRRQQIERDLRLVGAEPAGDAFDRAHFDDGERTLVIRTRKHTGIALAENGIADYSGPNVRLHIEEVWSYRNIEKSDDKKLQLIRYSYGISYDSLIEITSDRMSGREAEHWGDILLTHRRRFHFDGEDAEAQNSKPLEYRNLHPADHFHPSAGEWLRLPVAGRPNILSVACFGLMSFHHSRWLDLAKKHADVLKATRIILPHVACE